MRLSPTGPAAALPPQDRSLRMLDARLVRSTRQNPRSTRGGAALLGVGRRHAGDLGGGGGTGGGGSEAARVELVRPGVHRRGRHRGLGGVRAHRGDRHAAGGRRRQPVLAAGRAHLHTVRPLVHGDVRPRALRRYARLCPLRGLEALCASPSTGLHVPARARVCDARTAACGLAAHF